MTERCTLLALIAVHGLPHGYRNPLPGFVDFLSLKERLRRITTAHLIINLIVVILFIINFAIRASGTPVAPGPLILSIIGIILAAISGWLGGEMVYVYGVAVESPPKA